ncbi:hypothetical protein PG995_002805 [Apiospora arundinis]
MAMGCLATVEYVGARGCPSAAAADPINPSGCDREWTSGLCSHVWSSFGVVTGSHGTWLTGNNIGLAYDAFVRLALGEEG